jgi:hypothetical protein
MAAVMATRRRHRKFRQCGLSVAHDLSGLGSA